MIPLGSGTIKLNFEKKQSIRLLKSPTELHLKKVVNDPNVDGYVEVVALEAPNPCLSLRTCSPQSFGTS